MSLFSFIWQFVKQQKWLFVGILLVSLGWAFDATIWPYLLSIVIDILTKHETTRHAAWEALKAPIFFSLCFWAFIEFGFRMQGFLVAKALPKLESAIRMAMFDHVQRHSPKYFNERFAGSLANKITDMTTQVSFLAQQILTNIIPATAACLLGILFFAKINPLFALLLATWICIHFSICFFFTKGCDARENLHGEVRSSLLGKIVDSLTNNYAVNLFYRFKFEKAGIGVLQKEERLANYLSKRYVEIMRLCMGFASLLLSGVGIMGFMIYQWLQGKLTTGEVAQIFNTTWNLTMLMWFVGMMIPSIFQSIGIAKQALTLMNEPQDILDRPHAKPLVVTKGEIAFENVSFHYGEKKIFQGKTIQIHEKEKVGLVGYSGAGKSTFISLILRFYPIKVGRILIDQQDIADVTLESLRKQIALIPQDPLLFHRSLFDNIHFGRLDATEKEVLEAARWAHCDEFITALPDGYQTLVGERGTKLSGGERQRIAIARALLANAPILILDEATSALDSVTEKYIQESLSRLMQNRTTLVIAHRLSTLAKMDRILVFHDGVIIEEGSHETLLALNGHYAKMWHIQALTPPVRLLE